MIITAAEIKVINKLTKGISNDNSTVFIGDGVIQIATATPVQNRITVRINDSFEREVLSMRFELFSKLLKLSEEKSDIALNLKDDTTLIAITGPGGNKKLDLKGFILLKNISIIDYDTSGFKLILNGKSLLPVSFLSELFTGPTNNISGIFLSKDHAYVTNIYSFFKCKHFIPDIENKLFIGSGVFSSLITEISGVYPDLREDGISKIYVDYGANIGNIEFNAAQANFGIISKIDKLIECEHDPFDSVCEFSVSDLLSSLDPKTMKLFTSKIISFESQNSGRMYVTLQSGAVKIDNSFQTTNAKTERKFAIPTDECLHMINLIKRYTVCELSASNKMVKIQLGDDVFVTGIANTI